MCLSVFRDLASPWPSSPNISAAIPTVISPNFLTTSKYPTSTLTKIFEMCYTYSHSLSKPPSCYFKFYSTRCLSKIKHPKQTTTNCHRLSASQPPRILIPTPMYTMHRNPQRASFKLPPPVRNIEFHRRELHLPLLPSLPSPPYSSPTAPTSNMSTYRNAVSSLPTVATYSATTLFLICQFRVKPTDDPDTADAIAAMHNNGVAPTFIKSLISAVLQSQPVPPTLQNSIDFEEVHFVSLSGDSPNYSVQFRAKIILPSKETDFARFGSDRYLTLKSFLYDFVFDRWHTKFDALPEALNVSKHLLNAIHFLIPPLNNPHSRPFAFISGIPPRCSGRQQIHVDLLTDSLHHSLKHKFDPVSKLHFLGYFRQSFGIQARSNYKFTKDHSTDVYVLFVSNTTDMTTLSPILFPSSPSPSSPLTALGIPITLIPIPSRPSSFDNGRLAAYYGSVTKIVQDIQTREGIMASLPSIVTASIRDPTSSSTRDILLRNKNIISYTVFYNKTTVLKTRLFLRKPCPQTESDPILRSWFSSKDRSTIFSTIAPTKNIAIATPDSIVLNNVLKNCQNTLAQYASALGVTLPIPDSQHPPTTPTAAPDTPTLPSTPTHCDMVPPTTPRSPPPILLDGLTPPSDSSMGNPSASHVTPFTAVNTPTTNTSNTSTSSITMPPPPRIPIPSLKPKQLLPPQSSLPPTLPLKRINPPSPPTTQSPTTLAPTSKKTIAVSNDNPPDNWEDSYESDDGSTTLNESDDDTDFDQSIRLHEFETKLTKSIPKKLRCYIHKPHLAELVNHIYISDNIETSIAESKNDLLCQVERAESRHQRSLKHKAALPKRKKH